MCERAVVRMEGWSEGFPVVSCRICGGMAAPTARHALGTIWAMGTANCLGEESGIGGVSRGLFVPAGGTAFYHNQSVKGLVSEGMEGCSVRGLWCVLFEDEGGMKRGMVVVCKGEDGVLEGEGS